MKNSAESLPNNVCKIDQKENLDMKNPTITDCESPTVETTKGISTSTSGDSISVSVSECNGHDSEVKENSASVQTGHVDNEVCVTANCDDNLMDQDTDERSQVNNETRQDTLDVDQEKGDGDATSMNEGTRIYNVFKSCQYMSNETA